jgi:SAM-dependent methyltransferase
MAELAHSFDDGAAYEQFMGRWSRAAGAIFLDWVAPPSNARWLDIGCGTGVFTELVLDTCSPAAMFAVDPAPAQVEYAHGQPVGPRANFRVASAEALPFPDAAFDVVASALTINFIPNQPLALFEMRRVTCAGGLVAGYVWDFAAELGPNWPLRSGMRGIGVEVPQTPGAEVSSQGELASLFGRAGFEMIATRPIEVTVSYPNFDEFWQVQTSRFNPILRLIDPLPKINRARLVESVRGQLPTDAEGKIVYSTRANAIKARAPA